MFDTATWLIAATILGTAGVIVGFWLAIYSPPSTPRSKHIAFGGAIAVVSIPCLIYLYSTWTAQISGDFEWQWAGENWIGTVEIANGPHQRPVKVDIKTVRKKFQPNGSFAYQQAQFFGFAEGALEGDKKGFRVSIPLVRSATGQKLKLDAELKPVEAYAGTARYTILDNTEQNGGTGDIILVRHRSQARTW